MEIYFDGTLIDSDNYISFSNDFKQFDESFMLGTTASNTITIEVPGNIAIPTNVLIKINNSNYSTMIVDSYEYEDNNILKLNLVDKMVLLDFNYNAQSIVPCTVKTILQDICTQAGITLATTTFTNESLSVNYYDNTITAREYVGMIAELNGGFARINTSGALELVKFSGTPTNIDIETCEDFRVGEKHKIERVVFDNGLLKFETSSDETKETLYLNSQNVFINTQAVFNNITSQILNFEFYCFSTGNCEINPNVRAGDLINFTDGTDNYPTIAQYSLNYVGGLNGGYELNINSQKQEETKIVGLGEQYKRLSVKIDRDKNEILETVESQISDVQKEINPTQTADGSSIYLEDSAETELIDFELEGKTEQESEPTPDNPSKLVSVGYENLLDLTSGSATSNGITATWENGEVTLNGTATSNAFIQTIVDIPQGTVVSISANNDEINNNVSLRLIESASGGNTGAYTALNAKNRVTNGYTALYNFTRFQIRIASGTTLTNFKLKPQLELGSIAHNYVPYGKYGIEVKTTGKNLFDGEIELGGLDINTGQPVDNNSRTRSKNFIKVQPNTTYSFTRVVGANRWVLGYDTNQKAITDGGVSGYQTALLQIYINVLTNTFTTSPTTEYIKWYDTSSTNLTEKVQIEKGSQSTTYEEYKENTYQYILNEPLRSIDNTKDLLYIKNGMLYVERKIGKTILDGTEEWTQTSSQALTNTCYFGSTIIDDQYKENESNVISNYFSQRSLWNNDVEGIQKTSSSSSSSRILRIRIDKTKASTANALKTWLSTHNTEVQYILAEPYTEELGEVQIPSTYKGITYIDTTDELEPNMNITYVRDTLIANYVEQHIAEIKINEEGITQRVESIEESDFGSRINEVEQRIDDDEVNWNVISTHIDRTTGDVREITTSNGMTFNENGLNIHTNQSTFNAQHTYDGTYYRDGEEVITETTISGFKATNLKNKGQHEYSYDDTNDLYEFVDERVEVDGEYCYATFYNGEE